MGTIIFAAMVLLTGCGSSAGPSPAPSTSQPLVSPPSISSLSPTSGPTSGGTTVTITGANFQKGATVTFGGVAATSVTFVSSTKLTATSPKGNAGTAAVVVTNPDGQTDSLTSGFTYTDSGSGGGGGGLSGSPGATATQYVLTYTASSNKMCTIEVSQNQSFTPLVHAVAPSIFPGSDSDGQTNNGQRTFVVGERTIAAETDTAPSITVPSGAAVRAPLKYDGYTTGAVTVAYSGQPFVAGDNIIVSGMSDSSFDSTWARVMSATGSSFTYWTPTTAAGSSGGGTITRSDHFSLALENNTTYYYRIGGPSNACGATPAEGTFTTMNWPNGDTFPEVFPTGPDGLPIVPTVFETHDTATNAIIDPLTGTLVRPLSLFSDMGAPIFASYTGSQHHCSMQTDSNGYFHCYVPSDNGATYLYAVSPTTGESISLGNLAVQNSNSVCWGGGIPILDSVFDESDPNVLYNTCLDQTNRTQYDLVKFTYTGNDVAVSAGAYAPITVTKLMGDLITALHNFDSNFNTAQFTGVLISGVQSHYVLLRSYRWNQDSNAWNAVADLTTDTIVAAMPGWGEGLSATCDLGTNSCANFPVDRWQGMHGSSPLQMSQGWIAYSGTQPYSSSGELGPIDTTLNQTGGLNATDTQDTITVTSTPVSPCPAGNVCGSVGDPMSASVPPDGSTFLDIARPGDIFQFTDGSGEYVMVLARNNATSLVIARGCHAGTDHFPVCDGTGEAAHADGADLEVITINTFNLNSGGNIFWNFIDDPHGQDVTDTYLVHDFSFTGGHGSTKEPNWVVDNWSIKVGSNTSAFLKASYQYQIDPNDVPFDGMLSNCYGNQGYPHYYPTSTTSVDFFWDAQTCATANTSDTSSLVSGTTYIYKYTFSTVKYQTHTFYPSLPYRAVAGGNGEVHDLINISAPGSMLNDTVADNWKYCVVMQAGECWTGSSPGDVYANLNFGSPNPSILPCRNSEAIPVGNDWCMDNGKAIVNGIIQASFLSANQIGTNNNNGVPIYGIAKTRRLIMGLYGPWRHILGHPQDLPDESWMYYDSCMSNPYIDQPSTQISPAPCGVQTYLVKVPPQPPDDGINRTTYANVPVAVGAASNGATHARLKYGYQEDGPVDSFYCTQYKNTCYYSDQNLPLNGTINVPVGIPQRVIFYQVEYLDSSDNVVTTGPVTAYAIP